MKSIIIFLLVLILSAQGKVAAQHHDSAKGNVQITDTLILRQLLNETGIQNKEVQMLIVDFPPNTVSAPHRHPCPTFGYILEGELESVFEGKKYTYKKGDSFFEMSNGLHSVTRNNSPTQTTKLLVFFITEKDKLTSIPEKKIGKEILY